MKLTPSERAILSGAEGPAVKRAMEIITTLGRIYGAEDLVAIASAQIAGVSYRNLGDAGLEFLQDWAAQGARVRVPATLNPSGMDHQLWRKQGFSAAFAGKQNQVVDAYASMGIEPTCTCTPYEVGNLPGYGVHLAWSESSAVVYANSVLGARTNREGGPSALAAAICGRTANYGLHRYEQRRATHRIRVDCHVREPDEFAALGYLVGKSVGDGIPYFQGIDLPPVVCEPDGTARTTADASDKLKLLGAALASSGAVGLYHIDTVTPEAQADPNICPTDVRSISITTLDDAKRELNHPVDTIDLVVIGCPHASPAEIEQIAQELQGRQLASALWVTTARPVRQLALERGWVQAIEAAGGLVTADGCVVVAPMDELRYRTLATNSAKMAAYALPHAGLQVRFGALGQCLRAAISGRWNEA